MATPTRLAEKCSCHFRIHAIHGVRIDFLARGRTMTKRHTRSIWVLILVVVVLGLAAVAENLREQRTAAHPLLEFDRARVDEIAIECTGCVKRRFQRVQGHWQMVQPWQIPADAAQVARLIDVGAAPMRRKFALAQIDATALGFVPPFAVLTVGTQRVEFGTTDAINHARYVRVADQVALVRDRVSALLLAAPERFVDPDPLAGLRHGATAVHEDGQLWTASRLAALVALRAEAISPRAAQTAQRVLLIRDGADRDHPFGLLVDVNGRWSLLRDDPPLAYQLPESAAPLFVD